MRFTANYANKVDKKGRVSVPARYRALLADSEFAGLVVYESFKLPCLEASSREFIDHLSHQLGEEFGAFEDEKEALAASILGAAFDLPFDGEGRILLPQSLLSFAGITETAVFVGVGEKFLIWEPKKWEAYREEQRTVARTAAARLGRLAPTPGGRGGAGMTAGHIPVMRDEVVEALRPAAGEIIVDATFGAGGYTRALLHAADCTVYAIDRDPEAIARGADLAREFAGRLKLLHGRFSQMEALLAAEGVAAVHGITLDIGVSSFQLETPERGFSFQSDGPLDMRMERTGETAADVVNARSMDELTQILRELGEERQATRVARAIVEARGEAPIQRTRRLAEIVERALGKPRPGKKQIHPATRTFQALRILVNDELGELKAALVAAERLLAPAGRLAVVAFHSLEDRIVKTFLAQRAGRTPTVSRHLPERPEGGPAPSFSLAKKGAIKPTAEEVAANPRARSARLRVAMRTEAPAWAGAA